MNRCEPDRRPERPPHTVRMKTHAPSGALPSIGASLFLSAVALALLAGPHGAAAQPQPAPTPTLGPVQTFNGPDGNVAAVAARTFLGQQVLGLSISCETPSRPLLTVYLGAFPTPARRLQLAVRRSDGQVERFGPVFAAGAESGFHSPQLDGADLRRFLAAIRGNGALVSNGFNSYFVRNADHASLRRFVDACRR